jgi:hypothetical protein
MKKIIFKSGFAVINLLLTQVAHAYTLFTPTTTISNETANNTTSSTLFTDRYQWIPNGSTSGPITPNGDIFPQNGTSLSRNISKLSITSLLYSGSTTRLYAHYMGWFEHDESNEETINGTTQLVDNARSGNHHIDVGYSSYDAAGTYMASQLQDMVSRGFSGVIIDWYGPYTPTRLSHSDLQVAFMKKFAEASNGKFKFGINIDRGSIWSNLAVSGGAGVLCSDSSGKPTTAEVCIADRINYIVTNYGSSPAYMRAADGNLAMHFFINPYWVDWKTVHSLIPANIDLIMDGVPGLNPANVPGSNGAFAWPGITALRSCTDGYPACSTDPWNIANLNYFYTQSEGYTPKPQIWGAVYKGFDDAPVNGWNACTGSTNCRNVVGQQCGMTWLETFQSVNKYYSSSNQLEAIQFPTWDDYEEGTEIETGIDNCMKGITTSVLSSGVLSFSPVGGTDLWGSSFNEATVHDYEIFASQDGSKLMLVGDVVVPAGGTTASQRTFSLTNLNLTPGSYQIFVKAVGQPNISNHLSESATFVAPAAMTWSTPTTVLASGSSMTISGKSSLSVQTNGDIVMTDANGNTVWSAGLGGDACSNQCHLIFQDDGNLVLYNAQSKPLWASNTGGAHAAYKLSVSATPPYLAVSPAAGGNPVWAAYGSTLPSSGIALFADTSTASTADFGNGMQMILSTQADVIVNQGTGLSKPSMVWHTGTAGKALSANFFVVFQSDANIVLYNDNTPNKDTPIWASNTGGSHAAYQMRVSPTAPYLAIAPVAGDNPIWAAYGSTVTAPGFSLFAKSTTNSVADFGNGMQLVLTPQADLILDQGTGLSSPNRVWHSGTSGKASAKSFFAVFQTDGNLVLYNVNDPSRDTPFWDTGTGGSHTSYQMKVSPSVPYLSIGPAGGAAVWSP